MQVQIYIPVFYELSNLKENSEPSYIQSHSVKAVMTVCIIYSI